MSYYRQNYYRNKRPKSKIRSKRGKTVIRTILYVLAVLAVVGFLANLIQPNLFDSFTKNNDVTVYLVPSSSWSFDGSNYGAWCWNNSGVPEGTFVLGTDKDEDGVYEFNIPADYSRMLFVDLVADATELGDDWSNKREQTDNLSVPSDKNVYYHNSVNEWSDSTESIYYISTGDEYVYINTGGFAALTSPVMYYFDKTGVNEPNFINMSQCGDALFIANIPAGYTHIIFIDYADAESFGTWDNIITQSADLVIPTGQACVYDTNSNTWITRD